MSASQTEFKNVAFVCMFTLYQVWSLSRKKLFWHKLQRVGTDSFIKLLLQLQVLMVSAINANAAKQTLRIIIVIGSFLYNTKCFGKMFFIWSIKSEITKINKWNKSDSSFYQPKCHSRGLYYEAWFSFIQATFRLTLDS